MNNNLTVKILEVGGLEIAAQYVGLPVGKIRSRFKALTSPEVLTQDSLRRLGRLIAKGDEHAKIMRQVVVHMEITAPRYWWQQWATYRAGMEMYSGSTMHTLMRGISSEDFVYGVQEDCQDMVDYFINESPSLGYAKANLPEGYLQTRLVMCSYQTLRRMWLQRRTHKLPEWGSFIQIMHDLPHCHDLIFVEPKNPWRELWIEWLDFDGEPWVYDAEQVATFCIFCGDNKEYGHSNTCVYTRVKKLLDGEAK